MTARLFIGMSLVICSTMANSADLPSGDWIVNVDGPKFYYASTSNSGGSLLAQYCKLDSAECFYLVSFGITCEENSKYPALVSTDAGAKSIELVCDKKVSNENFMLAANFDEMDDLVRNNKRIGFVIPMQNEEFKAIRFSLNGADIALDAMRAATLKHPQERAQHKTKDVERL
jgi:hypothetical protein